MIFPRSFRKASIENRLDRDFHLFREEPVPRGSFLQEGRPFKVSAVFQIWVRLPTERPLRSVRTTHPDFEFTTPDRAHFSVQRVGGRAGRVHRDFDASPNSHYFIRGRVKGIMQRLALADAAADATGNPSLAKSEIVARYDAYKTGGAVPGPLRSRRFLCPRPHVDTPGSDRPSAPPAPADRGATATCSARPRTYAVACGAKEPRPLHAGPGGVAESRLRSARARPPVATHATSTSCAFTPSAPPSVSAPAWIDPDPRGSAPAPGRPPSIQTGPLAGGGDPGGEPNRPASARTPHMDGRAPSLPRPTGRSFS